MVKAELSIETKNNQLNITMDLLKREDWKQDEWELANNLQESLIGIIDLVKASGLAKETKREIIKEDSPQ